jgi:NAD(P)-dependent dehydrogenase (short-subunit alcohol dehydrogenase family)
MKSKGIALVTGAGTRVGKSIAIRLGTAGYTVAVHYNKSRKGAQSTVTQLNKGKAKSDKKSAAFPANLRNVTQMRKLVTNVEKKLGPITLLVNSASEFKQLRLIP